MSAAIVLRVTAGQRLYTVPMTGHFDGLEHHVRDVDQAAASSSGIYRTLCGEAVVPAPLTTPEGTPCVICLGVLAASLPPAPLVSVRRRLLTALRQRRRIAPAAAHRVVAK